MKFDNIFVIDDDKIFHFIFNKLIATNNINISPAYFENGLLAIESLKSKLHNGENQPDLILLDINMPVLDGWQFLEEYKKIKERIKKDITIYIVSSSDNQVDIDKAKNYEEEVQNYYLKPITADDLRTIFSEQ